MIVADMIVIGGGVVGLAIVHAAAARGLSVALFTVDQPGAAWRASAGLLVPHYSGEGAAGSVAAFMAAARDGYVPYVAAIEEQSGVRIPCAASGAIELANSDEDVAALWAAAPADAERLQPAHVRALEPSLAPFAGGLLYPRDGAVDNVRLTGALASISVRQPRVRVIRETARRIEIDHAGPAVLGDQGSRAEGRWVVLAAGAWSARLDGLPRDLPVRPLRGQICTFAGAPLHHVVLGPQVYLVSRDESLTLVGSTMEDVGFDPRTTDDGIAALRAGAGSTCRAFVDQPVVEAWGGLRPATPDLLPIIGPDPDHPALLYACGHSRNGILLAPITAAIIAALAAEERPNWDLSPFAIRRFERDRR